MSKFSDMVDQHDVNAMHKGQLRGQAANEANNQLLPDGYIVDNMLGVFGPFLTFADAEAWAADNRRGNVRRILNQNKFEAVALEFAKRYVQEP
jgi:hypothetical protein